MARRIEEKVKEKWISFLTNEKSMTHQYHHSTQLVEDSKWK